MHVVCFIIVYLVLLVSANNGTGTFKTTHLGPRPIWNDTHLDRLKKDLLQNYDRFLRPEHSHNATKLTISLTILHLETDEAKSIIMVDSWLALEWTDSKLKWNEKDYAGQSNIKIGDHEIWQPDIYLYNSVVRGGQLSRVGSKNLHVYSDGKVLWIPQIKLTALCDYNMRYWPFDQQYCYLKLGSWTYSSNEIKIENNFGVAVDDSASASSWEIQVKAEVKEKKYQCCLETYGSMIYHLNITRKSTPYSAIVVTPAVVSTILLLTQFGLPPYAKEKIILNGCSLLLLNLFLLYFNHQIYTACTQTPLIVLFYSSSLYIAGLTTLSSAVTSWMCTVRNTKPLSNCLRKLLQAFEKWLLIEQYPCVSTYQERGQPEEIKDDEADEETDKKHTHTNLIQNEWTILAVCIDRLLFIMCIFTFIILAIRLS